MGRSTRYSSLNHLCRLSKPKTILIIAGIALFLFVIYNSSSSGNIVYESTKKTSRGYSIFITDEGEGIRQLRFSRDGVRQGEIKLGDPDYIGLPYIETILSGTVMMKPPRSGPPKVLLYGLGSGALATNIHHHWKQSSITVVEWDKDVVEAVQKYMGFKQDERMKVIVSEGFEFLRNCNEKFDLIVQDGCAGAPCNLVTIDGFQRFLQLLTPNGLFLQNVYDWQPSVFKNAQKVFPASYVIDSRRVNKILVGTAFSERFTLEELEQKGRLYTALEKPSFDPVPHLRQTIYITDTFISSPGYEE